MNYNSQSTPRESAQAIVIDRGRKVYLEDNQVIEALSFIGGGKKVWENFDDTIIREVKEEIGLVLAIERFLWAELQPVRRYWNKRKWRHIEWKSMYYILVLENEELVQMQERIKLEVYTIDQLNNLDISRFPEGRKDEFLAQVRRALTFV